jgi:predicted lysophospholipase L1 biosynthesis ABC-type transport system permease subunit
MALTTTDWLQLALAGIAIGVAISWLAMRSLSGLLFGVSSHDPLTFAGTIGFATAIAAAASFVPARRATAIPLTEALRADLAMPATANRGNDKRESQAAQFPLVVAYFSANLAPAHVFVLDHFATRVQSPPMAVVEIG